MGGGGARILEGAFNEGSSGLYPSTNRMNQKLCTLHINGQQSTTCKFSSIHIKC